MTAFSLSKFIRYGVVGALGAVTHMSILFLLVELQIAGPVPASAAGFACALATSYWINRLWTFGYQGSYWITLFRYTIVSLIGLIMNILIISLFTEVLGLWYGWGAFVAVGAVALNNFLLNNTWTFAPRPPAS